LRRAAGSAAPSTAHLPGTRCRRMKEFTMRWPWQCLRAARKPTARRPPPPKLEQLEDRLLLANVTYHGGPLLQNVQVSTVYYGQPWTTSAALQQTITQT